MIKYFCDFKKCGKELKETKNVICDGVMLSAEGFVFKISIEKPGHLCIGCFKELISKSKIKPEKLKHTKSKG
ncbi:hypothetical protein ES703_50461 [subsurface metagenome]